MNETTKTVGVLGLLLTAAIFAGLSVDPTDVYVCSLTQEFGAFDRISDSGKTAYYSDDEGEHSVRCNIGREFGVWIPYNEYNPPPVDDSTSTPPLIPNGCVVINETYI